MAEHKVILDVDEYNELEKKAHKYDMLVAKSIRTVKKSESQVRKQLDGSYLVEMAYWDIERN